MIPRDYITEWREQAPWVEDAQVEQDLVISRALIDIFSNETLHRLGRAKRAESPAKESV